MAQTKEKTLEQRIEEYDWPYPANFKAGMSYLWVPVEQYAKHIEDGWKFTGMTHRFEGHDYMLVCEGVPLRFVRSHQTSCDLQVWVPDAPTKQISGEVMKERSAHTL